MLTAKENMRQTIIAGGKPDRFVNQFEALKFLPHPIMLHRGRAQKGEMNVVDAWGVTMSFPENVPGAFPVHTPEKILVKDFEHWQDYVHAPKLDYPQEEWDRIAEMYKAVDHDKVFTASMFAPGIFEQVHYLCSMTNALEYYIMYPDEMHDLIKYLTDWELQAAEQICGKLHPEIMFHHDDWGSSTSSFLRPSMFEEFFLDAYKQVYGYYHDHGVEFIIHHSDSYGANLVDTMVEMGIDVWQGCVEENDIPALNKKYNGTISFMGDINNKSVDFEGWTEENCRNVVRRALETNTMKNFIPCIIQGGAGSVFPGVYESLTKAIDEYNAEKFGMAVSDIENMRVPGTIMFR